MKSHLNSISSPSQKNSPSTGSVQLVKQYGAENYCLVVTPSLVNFVWEIRLCFGLILNTL